jgi:hypothetical protein
MRTVIFISALMMVSSCFVSGQSQDTAAVKQQDQQKVGQVKTDKFIDRDGDGICDRREEGLGFKRGKHREEKMRGKNQNMQGKQGAAGTTQPTGSGTGKQYRGRK